MDLQRKWGLEQSIEDSQSTILKWFTLCSKFDQKWQNMTKSRSKGQKGKKGQKRKKDKNWPIVYRPKKLKGKK